MTPLQYLQAKTRRSGDHLRAVQTELTSYVNRAPVRFEHQLDELSKEFIFKVAIVEELPVNVRIFAGEVLTHLRSALDHLAWQLALTTTQTPNKSTEFPVYLSEDEFKKSARRKIDSLPAGVQATIEELQPYRQPEPAKSPLWRLHRLANVDKHRLITVVNSSLTGMGVQWLADGMSFETTIGPLSDGKEVGRIDFSEVKEPFDTEWPSKVGPTIQMVACFQIDGDDSILPVLPALMGFGAEVEMIIRRFEKIL